MKPILLKMQAIGAYPDYIEIPFDKLGNLYLINGVTGSGKTTIFDAICFALFNTSSGELRGNSAFRSHFAKEDTESFVDFSFLFNGDIYRIYRTPSFKRKKAKGEGYTEAKQVAQLYLPNGEIISGITNVDNAVVEILGVNANQFCQIALLAQGEFLKLLNATTETRSEIFRNIFKTQDFLNLSLKLKDKMLLEKVKFEDLQKTILHYTEQIISKNDEINNLKRSFNQNKVLVGYDEFISKVQEQNILDERYLLSLKKESEKLENEHILLSHRIEAIKSKKDLINKEIIFKNELKNIESDFFEFEKEYKMLGTLTKEKEEIKLKLSNLLNDVEKAKTVLLRQSEQNKLTQELQGLKNNLKKCLDDLKIAKINCLKNLFLEYKNLENSLKEKQNELIEFKQKYDKKRSEYIEFENIYFASQAGILAQNLKENTPCPVCGSKIHPNVAKLNYDCLSTDELKERKIALDKMLETLNNISEYASKLVENSKNSYNLFLDTKEQFGLEIDENDLNFEGAKKDYKKEIKTIEENIEEIKKAIELKSIEISAINSELDILSKDLKTREVDKIIEEYENLNLKAKNIEEKIEIVDKNYNNQKVLVEKQKSNIDLIQKQIKEKAEINENDFEKESEHINKIKQEISLNKLQTEENNIRLKVNTGYIDEILKNYKTYIEIEKNYKEYKILSDLANGCLKDKPKITFEQYIQGYFLDLVLYKANKHLKVMTKNQFQILRKREITSKVSKTALELEVMDFHTFKTRSTKTLSGGESFKASLSLALGLSDCVSDFSGAINMEALFIDEGFGSLDSESIENAMKVITDLSLNNRQIGIISHVEDLKDKIPSKITSIKTDNGSTVEISLL